MPKFANALASMQKHVEQYQTLQHIFSQTSLNLEQPTKSVLSGGVWTTAALALVFFVGSYVSLNPIFILTASSGFLGKEDRRKSVVFLQAPGQP